MKLFLGQPNGKGGVFGVLHGMLFVLATEDSLMTAVRDEDTVKMDCSCQHTFGSLDRTKSAGRFMILRFSTLEDLRGIPVYIRYRAIRLAKHATVLAVDNCPKRG